MMFSLLIWILMCAAFCIQSGTSSNAGVSDPQVSLTCNENQEVLAGKTLRLNCTIQLLGENCPGDEFVWEDSNNNIICNRTTYKTVNYSCEWDGETYVSLDIEEVTGSQKYTVQILTECGSEDRRTIMVQLIEAAGVKVSPTPPNLQPEEDSSLVTVIGSVFIIVSVLGILSALLTTKRGKEILKRVRRGKNPEYMDASQDSA